LDGRDEDYRAPRDGDDVEEEVRQGESREHYWDDDLGAHDEGGASVDIRGELRDELLDDEELQGDLHREFQEEEEDHGVMLLQQQGDEEDNEDDEDWACLEVMRQEGRPMEACDRTHSALPPG